jgi:DNA processing protein
MSERRWRVSPDEAGPGWPAGFVRTSEDRRALLTLASLRGITPRRLYALAWSTGSAAACLEAVRLGEGGSDLDREWAERIDPNEVLRATQACGATFVANGDPGFPQELNDLLHDPPGWLFVRGRSLRSGDLRVAVVGARRCSPLGREVAHALGRRLAGAGVSVVSGAAHGIDGASHRGALAAPGPTVAVLGSGIDVFHPPSNRELLGRIAAVGTVVSEYPPGTSANPWHFPARNRLVAALARALVVVEGASRSGSRISVEHALDLGREVFAVPGPVTSPLSETPLELLREGAIPIRGADDLLEDLGVAGRLAVEPPPGLPEVERRVYAALGGPCLPDAVARTASLSVPEVVEALLGLELRGLVRSVAGRYERTLAV